MTRRLVADLIGDELDIAVALADGHPVRHSTIKHAPGIHEQWPGGNWEFIRRPSTVWEHGGPIIARARLSLDFLDGQWHAWCPGEDDVDARMNDESSTGPTLLVAAMRAYVASKFGESIDLEALLARVSRLPS